MAKGSASRFRSRGSGRSVSMPWSMTRRGTAGLTSSYGTGFAVHRYAAMLVVNGIDICMEGKGVWRENVFGERLWRCGKYEECICEPS